MQCGRHRDCGPDRRHLRATNRENQRNLFLRREFGNRWHNRGIDDAHEQIDLFFADQAARLVERLLRIAGGVGVDQLDRHAGDLVADRIEVELDSRIDLLAEDGKGAGGGIEHADLDRVTRRGTGARGGILRDGNTQPSEGEGDCQQHRQESFHWFLPFVLLSCFQFPVTLRHSNRSGGTLCSEAPRSRPGLGQQEVSPLRSRRRS